MFSYRCMPMAARSYQGSVPTSTISFTRNECAVRMMAPTLNGLFDRSTAMRTGRRSGSRLARISSRGSSKAGTFMAPL